MNRSTSFALQARRRRRTDLIETLALIIAIGLALMLTCTILAGLAIDAGSAPEFDQRIALDAEHILVVHHGPGPTCAYIPNPPQHDCFWPGPAHRVFSVDYLTPHGARSLVWLRLPAH